MSGGGRRIFAAACLMLVLAPASAKPDSVPWGDLTAFIPPVFATSCGQGTGTAQVRESCERLGIVCWDRPQLRMGDLGAICCAEAGCPFGGVLLVEIGINDEALRALDIDITYEADRCRALLERARELGMVIILARMREPPQAANEVELELLLSLAPWADLIITCCAMTGRATIDLLSGELGIPWIELAGPEDLDILFSQLFRQAT